MIRVHLALHGTGIALSALDPVSADVVKELVRDFEGFISSDSGNAEISLQLGNEPLQLPPGKRKLFETRMCAVYGMGRERWCDYGDGCVVYASNSSSAREFVIAAPDRGNLYEVAHAALLSAAGEALDCAGYHRVHALGFQHDDNHGLLILPRGGGKSAIAWQLLQDKPGNERVRIHSDEMPLIRSGALHPFPVRVALAPKVAEAFGISDGFLFPRKIFPPKLLVKFPSERVAKSGRVTMLLIGRKGRAGKNPRIQAAPRAAAIFALLKNMVVGIGLPQMAEHMLRLESLPRLVLIALSRLREAVQITVQADCYFFDLEWDARQNYRELMSFLEWRLRRGSNPRPDA